MFARSPLPRRWPRLAVHRRYHEASHGSSPFKPRSSVILKKKRDPSSTPFFIDKLIPGARKDTHRGTIHHDEIIGKRVQDTISLRPGPNSSKSPSEFILHPVRLDEYITMTRRMVTPLYPQDARLIVDLLDLHPGLAILEDSSTDEPPLEILEAGTGHGALTLYLSRAIHAANRHAPSPPCERRAVIHSVEISPRYSTHAQSIVAGFRHGLYTPNIDFHVGNVSDWLRNRLSTSSPPRPFLSRAFLDLPSSDEHLATTAAAMKTDGVLIVFNPSVTQILACFEKVKGEKMPWFLERVVELGVNGGTGGREWNVQAVRPRAMARSKTDGVEVEEMSEEGENQEIIASQEGETDGKDGWKMICRPKVGGMTVGGGFLAVFRRSRTQDTASETLDDSESA